MTAHGSTWFSERPINSASQDALERGGFVERFVDALVDPQSRRSTGVVVGVTGPWGSGKSSVLNLIEARIRETYPRALVIRFDPWLVSGREELIALFLDQFLKTLEARAESTAEWREAAKALTDYAEALSTLAKDVNGLLGSLLSTFGWLGRRLENRDDKSIAGLRQRLAQRLRGMRIPIVVLIDELDRVEDAEVRAVAQLVRAVVDFPGISYVLAYDYERVIEALGMISGADRSLIRQRGRNYLEKIVQFSVPLPIAERATLRRLLEGELRQLSNSGISIDFHNNQSRYDEISQVLLEGPIETPRDVKRTVGQFRVLESMTRGEVDPIDLLGYAALSTKSPTTIERIRRSPERFVDDPLDSNEQILRASRSQRSVEAVEDGDLTQEASALCRRLFPAAFGQSRTQNTHPLAISRRRTLLTVLRLGLSPSDVSRDEITTLFDLSPDEIAARLRQAEGSGRLGEYIDRIDELHSLIPNTNTRSFWRGLALYCEGSPDLSPQEILNKRETISSASRIFLGRHSDAAFQTDISRNVLNSLYSEGDVNICPDILRIHYFMYGLYGRREQGSQLAFLERVEVMSLSESWVSKWLSELRSGAIFEKISGMSLFFAAVDTGQWDESCRDYMTDMLHVPKNTDRMALIMFGGNHILEDDYLDIIIDRQEFVDRCQQRLGAVVESTPSHQLRPNQAVLAAALERAIRGLRGRD